MNHTTEFTQLELEFPQTKLCECGCGTPLPIPKYPSLQRRFISGHHTRGRITDPPEKRFWKYVDKNGPQVAYAEGRCWIWTGGKNGNGYGNFHNGKPVAAHRYSWELHNGPIPDGLWVLHKCDNGAGGCVNPGHLFLGTHQDNMDDKVAKNRQARSVGRKGILHHRSRLTDDKVREIRKRYANGEKGINLAPEYGVGRSVISVIVNRKAWAHVE